MPKSDLLNRIDRLIADTTVCGDVAGNPGQIFTTRRRKKKKNVNEGSHTLGNIIKTSSDKQFMKKYQELVQSDYQEFGSDPYSGSWATIPKVKIVGIPPEYMGKKITKKVMDDLWEWIFDNTEKYGAAKAIKTPKGYIVGGWAVS